MEKRDQPNLYCSRSCSASASKQRELFLKRSDEEEQNKFEEKANKHRQKLFDQYTELIRQAERLRIRIEREKPCKECGEIFVGDSKNTKYCCEACRKRAANRDHDKRIYRNGQPDLSITLMKVYKRDGGICQICGKKIGFDCDSNSDNYPSIDHIIPLSKGGLHQWDNVQLSCRGCNTAKGGKIYPPMRDSGQAEGTVEETLFSAENEKSRFCFFDCQKITKSQNNEEEPGADRKDQEEARKT